MNKIGYIILAAGKGIRMKSPLPKVALNFAGKPMINRVIDAINLCDEDALKCVVVGYKFEEIKKIIPSSNKVIYAYQEKQLGTGHAVIIAKRVLEKLNLDYLIILCGDTPLIQADTLKKLLEEHYKTNSSCTILTTILQDPKQFGRIVKDENKQVQKIVENKDATQEERGIKEINSGIYCFKTKDLFSSLNKINNNNYQKEYYLTDVIKILKQENKLVSTYTIKKFWEVQGVNSQKELLELENIYQKSKLT